MAAFVVSCIIVDLGLEYLGHDAPRTSTESRSHNQDASDENTSSKLAATNKMTRRRGGGPKGPKGSFSPAAHVLSASCMLS